VKSALIIVALIVAASFGWTAYRHAASGMQHAIAAHQRAVA
jgi:hypothetical protein